MSFAREPARHGDAWACFVGERPTHEATVIKQDGRGSIRRRHVAEGRA